MSRLVMGLGAFFILVGLWVLISPDQMASALDWKSRQAQYLAAGGRVVIGLLLMLSASATRYPRGLKIFGGVVLVAGLGLAFLPLDLWEQLIQEWLIDNLDVYRVAGGVVGVLLGAFLIRAAVPQRPTT